MEVQQFDESKPLVVEMNGDKHHLNSPKESEMQNTFVEDGSDKTEDSLPSDKVNNSPPKDSERSSSPLHKSKEVNQSEELKYSEFSNSDSSNQEIPIPLSEKEFEETENTFIKSEEPQLLDNLDKPTSDACEARSTPDHISTTLKAPDNSLVPKGEAEQKMSKSDRQIIEKIRSYYEAAEAVVEEGQMTRRNSFSHIPTGLVKDSVSRFNVCVRQESLVESESGPSDSIKNYSPSSLLPKPNQTEIINHQESADTASPSSLSDVRREQNKLDSGSAVEREEQICEQTPCMKLWKEKEVQESQNNLSTLKENSSVEPTENKETSINCMDFVPQSKRSQCDENTSSPSNLQTTEKADISPQSVGTRMSPNGSLDSLPCQIKVGRWSRQGKAVSCSRTLYEGMAEVPDLGFFESGPVNQCMVENSEKILNKVQMLARMYTAKASSMKVPLHQKRTRVNRATWSVEGKVSAKSKQQMHQADVRIISQPGEYMDKL